jgi:DNA-binding PadR family transcriptional regulator
MEIIILGLLIIKECTIYELRKIIDIKLASMSSNSMGSIQAAVKKLLGNDMLAYSEFVENSVNKKVYKATEKGKVYFLDSISKPMRYREKNMELGKLYFMGFAPGSIRADLISAYISQLKEERAKYEELLILTQNRDAAVENYMEYLDAAGSKDSFKKMLDSESLEDGIRDIALFQYATLDFSIEKLEFEIHWFEQFLKKAENGAFVWPPMTHIS